MFNVAFQHGRYFLVVADTAVEALNKVKKLYPELRDADILRIEKVSDVFEL